MNKMSETSKLNNNIQLHCCSILIFVLNFKTFEFSTFGWNIEYQYSFSNITLHLVDPKNSFPRVGGKNFVTF